MRESLGSLAGSSVAPLVAVVHIVWARHPPSTFQADSDNRVVGPTESTVLSHEEPDEDEGSFSLSFHPQL
jgi:hypothetical protein